LVVIYNTNHIPSWFEKARREVNSRS
jgi:hypothetical protein